MPYTYDHPHPAVTVDIVLFSPGNGGHAVLLIRRKAPPFEGQWALPGGFVEINESLEAAAARELAEETGITGVNLTQFHTFGAPGRDPRERVISVAHWGILPRGGDGPMAGSDAADARWFPLDALPALAFDHADILRMARVQLETGT